MKDQYTGISNRIIMISWSVLGNIVNVINVVNNI